MAKLLAPTKSYRELPVTVFDCWETVDLVRAALLQHELGYFRASAYMVDAMGRDARIAGVLSTRVNGLLALPLDFVPDQPKKLKFRKAAERVQQLFSSMASEADLAQLQRWGVMMGIGVAEKVWTTTADGWVPRLKVWHPSFLTWRPDTQSFWLTTMDGQVEIPEDGGDNWVVYCPYGYKRGWMDGRVRALGIPWLMRGWALRDWARFTELYGMGLMKAFVPSGAEDDDKDRFVSSLANRNSEPVVECAFDPNSDHDSGYDVEMLQISNGTAWDAIPGLVERAESDIAIAVLGQNLTTEVKQGSRAAAQVHQGVKQEIIQSDGVTLGRCLQQQLLRPWAAFNIGDPDLAPLPSWATTPPEDKASKATALKDTGAALVSMKAAGAPVDVRALLDSMGVPLLTLEQEAAQKLETQKNAVAVAAATPPPVAPGKPDAEPAVATEPNDEQLLSLLSRRDPTVPAEQLLADLLHRVRSAPRR